MLDGLTLYTKEELMTYLTMICRVENDYKNYHKVALEYQTNTWKGLPWHKKVLIYIKDFSLLREPERYYNLYHEKFDELSRHYNGTSLLSNIALITYNNDCSVNTSVDSLLEFAQTGKDCYLGVGCVEIINLLDKNYYKLDCKEDLGR